MPLIKRFLHVTRDAFEEAAKLVATTAANDSLGKKVRKSHYLFVFRRHSTPNFRGRRSQSLYFINVSRSLERKVIGRKVKVIPDDLR
jgi:hypothetical protein